MQFLMSDADVVQVIQDAIRRPDGLLEVTIPRHCLPENKRIARKIVFLQDALTVSFGATSLRLAPLQFNLLKYVYTHGTVVFEELQDAVWGTPATDNTIRATLSRLNSKLLESGIPVEVTSHHSKVSLEFLD